MEALPQINKFLEEFSTARGWGPRMTNRLQAVAEETLLVLSETQKDERDGTKRLLVSASSHGAAAELEFVSASGNAENLEDRIALLTNPGPEAEDIGDSERAVERDAALRLLRHYTASVTHRQHHDIEVIAVRVAPPARE